jgi:hypothetical protein
MKMIEKVARAIDPESFRGVIITPDIKSKLFAVQLRQRQEIAISKARLAIKTMREPTQEMYDDAMFLWDGDFVQLDAPAIAEIWQTMINAALEEE